MSKRILSLLIALTAVVTLSTAQIHNAQNILPKPTKMEFGNSNSKFTLSPTTKVVCKLEDKNVKYALNELNKLGVELFGKAFKKGTKSLYESIRPWNVFLNIQEIDFTGIEDVKYEDAKVKGVYDLHGKKVENPINGIYIINGKKTLIK